jgi:hypothetical protein
MSVLGRFLLTKDMAALQETAIPHLLEAKLTEPSNPFHWQLCIVGGVDTPWQVSSAVHYCTIVSDHRTHAFQSPAQKLRIFPTPSHRGRSARVGNTPNTHNTLLPKALPIRSPSL